MILSGDTAGFIVPCGCTTKQFGGLPRRATYLAQARKETATPLLYVDAGGSIARGTDYDRVKLTYIWKGMAQMQPVALNIGAGEVTLDAVRLNELSTGLPLISANVQCEDGAARWPAYVSANAENLKIAIAGVCMQTVQIGNGLRILDPENTLRALVPKLAAENDAVVLLVYGGQPLCQKLQEEFPELSAVLAAGLAQPVKPVASSAAIFAVTAQKGKFLARIDVSGHRNAWNLKQGEIVELSETFGDDPRQVANLDSYKAQLKREPLEPSQTGEAPELLTALPTGYRYAGSLKCAECHAPEALVHAASHHAHALKTLKEKNFDYDPFCLKCHTVGYGGPGGFTLPEKTPQLGGVGCENCHGPSVSHSADPKIKTTMAAHTACAGCHDPENSPRFDFAQYWPRIAHGTHKY